MRTRRPSSAAVPSFNRLHRLTECRRRYYYQYVRGLEPTAADETKLRAGQAGHAGMDVLYRLGWDALPAAEQALADAWAGYEARGNAAYLNEAHLQGILRGYHSWAAAQPALVPVPLLASVIESSPAFRGGSYETDAAGRILMTEPSLDVEIAPGLVVQVVPDLLAESDGELRVWDHKWTADYLGDGLTKRVRFSKQLPLYVVGMEALLGRPIDGAAINGIYMGEYALSERSTALRFARYEFDFNASQRLEAIAWARHGRIQAVAAEAADAEDEQSWLQHGGRHCGWCPFGRLCEVGGHQRLGRMKAEYRPRERPETDDGG